MIVIDVIAALTNLPPNLEVWLDATEDGMSMFRLGRPTYIDVVDAPGPTGENESFVLISHRLEPADDEPDDEGGDDYKLS